MRPTEIKVGLFIILAGVAMVAILIWLSRARFGGTFDIVFNEVSGLEKRVPARLGGFKIGEVTDISIRESYKNLPASQGPYVVVQVTLTSRDLTLPEPDQPRSEDTVYLYTGYRYLVAGGSLLGSKYVTISKQDKLGQRIPVNEEQILRRGGWVIGEDPIGLEEVVAKVDYIAQKVAQVLDPTTADHLQRAIAGVDGTVQEARLLMGKVNQATGKSGERMVRIVSSVDQATQNLDRLLVDNKIQVGRLLTHLARASNRFDQALQRSAPDFQRLTQNLVVTSETLKQSAPDFQRLTQNLVVTSETLKQVVASNEEHFNRLAQELGETTQTVRRMLQENEPEVHRMLASLAETSAEMQRMLSPDEGPLGALMENLDGLTEDLRRTLAENQGDFRAVAENLATLSGTLQGFTQEVQGDLKRTAANLDQLTGHINELVAGNRGSLNQILTEIGQTSQSLTAVSSRLQKVLEDEQWIASIQQSLQALQSTSEEAARTMENLRTFLTDPELQRNLQGTVQNLAQATAQGQQVLEKTNRFLSGNLWGGLGQPQLQVDLRYRPEPDRFQTDVNVRLHQPGKSFWQVGWEDATEGDRFNLQYGVPIRPRQTLRAGLYRSKLGIGWEYGFRPGSEMVLDLFDPNKIQLNLRTYYRLRRNWQISLGVEDLGDDNDFTGGVRYAPEMNW